MSPATFWLSGVFVVLAAELAHQLRHRGRVTLVTCAVVAATAVFSWLMVLPTVWGLVLWWNKNEGED